MLVNLISQCKLISNSMSYDAILKEHFDNDIKNVTTTGLHNIEGLDLTIINVLTKMKVNYMKNIPVILQGDVIDVLKGKKSQNTSVLRVITSEISVRKGKFGPYVFYKTNKMKKPKFIPMKGISMGEVNEQWVRDKL